MDAMKLLSKIAATYQAVLGDELVGVYAHGSLAMGCFRENLSDLDFLVVVSREPTQNQKEAMIQTLLALTPQAPKKGFEMSVVLASSLKPFVYPTPFVLHFSNRHLENAKRDITMYCEGMRGTDVDIAAHCVVTRECGMALLGRPVEEVFGEVDTADYIDSVWLDIEGAEDDVTRDPVYVILNLCRTLGYLATGRVMSKAQGAQWAIDELPIDGARVASQALAAYTEDAPITLSDSEMKRFCRDALNRIEQYRRETAEKGDK